MMQPTNANSQMMRAANANGQMMRAANANGQMMLMLTVQTGALGLHHTGTRAEAHPPR